MFKLMGKKIITTFSTTILLTWFRISLIIHIFIFLQLHEIYSKVCKKRQMGAVDHSEFQGITTLLESRGMIGIKKAKETRLAKVS